VNTAMSIRVRYKSGQFPESPKKYSLENSFILRHRPGNRSLSLTS
jgi:hypothetical protein